MRKERILLTKTVIYTVCMIQKGEQFLFVNRPAERGFPGFIAPGGKVEAHESPSEAAIREVAEETGLQVTTLYFKGLDEFVEPTQNYRYMVFNYLATSFDGVCLAHPPEGSLHWLTLDEVKEQPMQPWFSRRLPLFLQEGTFEIHQIKKNTRSADVIIHYL